MAQENKDDEEVKEKSGPKVKTVGKHKVMGEDELFSQAAKKGATVFRRYKVGVYADIDGERYWGGDDIEEKLESIGT